MTYSLYGRIRDGVSIDYLEYLSCLNEIYHHRFGYTTLKNTPELTTVKSLLYDVQVEWGALYRSMLTFKVRYELLFQVDSGFDISRIIR